MSFNRVLLLGRLGSDPEMRYTPNQTAVCTFRLATNERRKNQNGEWGDHTEWHTVVTFGKTAENCNQYLQKGRQAFVEGKIQTRKWQDQEGKDRFWTEIIANTVTFVGGRAGDTMEIEKTHSSAPKGKAAGGIDPAAIAGGSSLGETISFDDDDIPF